MFYQLLRYREGAQLIINISTRRIIVISREHESMHRVGVYQEGVYREGVCREHVSRGYVCLEGVCREGMSPSP